MQVRRFEATTMKDALSAVKRDLGSDAVILSTKELPSTSQDVKLYEVTAASAVTSSKAGASAQQQPSYDPSASQDLLARVSELNEIMPTKSQMRLIEGGIRDVKSMLVEVLRTQNLVDDKSGFLFPIKQRLEIAGVDSFIISDLTRHMNSLPPPSEIAKVGAEGVEAYYQDQAIRWMMKRIKISPKWNATPGITAVHAFVGTPGAGKTTLMSKIATGIQKRDKHRIALISFDEDKVAASEQTRVYAKILNIPHQVVGSPHEIKKVVLGLKGIDIVLIDTPGQNPNDTQAIRSLETIKGLGLSLDFHLVVSAAEKLSLSERAVSCFSPLGLSSLAVTKLDECPVYGEAFTLTSKWSIPLSYLAYSGSISDGLERATREKMLERIFNV
jgi:flagellar biosynthesis protein FlhF